MHLRKPFLMSYLEHKNNDLVRSKSSFHEVPQEPHLAPVQRQKLAWFRCVMRYKAHPL